MYNTDEPYCNVDYVQRIKEYLSDETAEMLKKHGLLDFINMIFNVFRNLLNALKSFFSLIKKYINRSFFNSSFNNVLWRNLWK